MKVKNDHRSKFSNLSNGRQSSHYSFVYLQISPFEFKNEATWANLQENKRILKWQPFWNKVYLEYTNLP